jgi:hypothetical protein
MQSMLQQAAGRRIRDANFIFVDKVTMMRAAELDAIVSKLDELCFRGVFMIVGNCAQLGAVLPGADDSTLIASAIVNADTFKRFKHFRLTGQMRMVDSELRDAVHSVGYSTWPSTSGGNHNICASQRIQLPTALFPAISDVSTGIHDFRKWVHGHYIAGSPPEGVIVCSTNARAEEHNLALLDDLPGDARTYTARDEVIPVRDGNQAFEGAHISSDCARAFNQSGVPPSDLILKVGAPVYVALNLERTEGLVKGALAVVHSLCKRMVYIQLCQPVNQQRNIWPMPRVCFEFQPDKLPIKIQQYQIPLRLAWAATVHRVIGDDLDRVGIDLRDPYFAHGQLHVSISRCHNRDQARFLVSEDDMRGDDFETVNVVEPRMLFNNDLCLN